MKQFFLPLFAWFLPLALAAGETVNVTALSSPGLKVMRTPTRMILGNIKIQAPEQFENALYVVAPRGPSGKPGMGYRFTIDRPATVYIAVHRRGKPTIPAGWIRTPQILYWGHAGHGFMTPDTVYRKDFPAGVVDIPPHDGFDGRMYGIPHVAILPQGTPPNPLTEWTFEQLQPVPKTEKISPNGRPLFSVSAGESFSCTVPAGVLKPGKVYLYTVSGSSRDGSCLNLSANRKLRLPFGCRNRLSQEFSRVQIPFVVEDAGELRLSLTIDTGSAQLEAPRLFEDRNGIRPQEGQIVNYYPSRDWKPVAMTHAIRIPEAGSALDFSRIAPRSPIGEEDRLIINAEGKCAPRRDPSRPLRFRGAGMRVTTDLRKIDRDIEQMKRLGINLVRFHGPDFVNDKYKRSGVTIDQAKLIPQSQEEFRNYFDEKKLRAFDYALNRLAENGIYIFSDLMAGFCGWTDANQSGHWVGKDLLGKEFHAQLYVNETFRRNWAEGVKYLLNRVNTVNGRRYADDPVLAFLLFMNEQDFRVSPSYLSAFTPEWEKFYGPGAPKLSEKLFKSDTPAGRKAGEFMQKKIQELTRFYHDVVRSTGCKALLTNWDLYMRMIDAPGRELLEVSTLHTYHGHAGLPLPAKSVPGYPVQTAFGAREVFRNNTSSLRSGGHYLARILAKQSLNRPVVVTEFADCAPNSFRHEMGLFFSGYAAEPNYDNMFAGSNFDAEDFDDYNVLQRDMQVDGGLRPVTEEQVIHVRNKAARAVQAVFRNLGLSPVSDEQVEAVTYAHGSKDTLPRDVTADLAAAEDVLKRGITGIDVVKALAETGFEDVAASVLNMLKQRVAGDYMQTAAILDRDFHVLSGVNTPNDYMGPGTGYRVDGERWEEIKQIPHIINPKDI